MGGIEGLMAVLDTRSYASVWYWLLLAGLWSWLGRGALGVPGDLVRAAQRGDADEAAQRTLLDWISLAAPRWRVTPRDGTILIAAAAFVTSALAVLGFGFDVQVAQAMTLLLAPLMLLAVLRVRLAARLEAIIRAGGESPAAAAGQAARAIGAHLRVTLILSAIAVGVAAVCGTRWLAMHPNGL